MERMTAAGRLGPPLVLLPGVPQVCALLDRCKSSTGTVGFEYIVELVGGLRKEPAQAYECVLCAVSLSTKGAVVHHLLQYTHKVLYLQKHFPLSLEPLRPFYRVTSTKVIFDGLPCRQALRYICQRIEDRFGRLMPAIIRYEHYMRSKRQYVQQIEDSRHFVEDVPVPLDQFQDAFNCDRGPQGMHFVAQEEIVDQSYYQDDGRYEQEGWVYNEEDYDDQGNPRPLQPMLQQNPHDERFETSRNVENAERVLEPLLNVKVTKAVSNTRFSRPDNGDDHKSRNNSSSIALGVTAKATQSTKPTSSSSSSATATDTAAASKSSTSPTITPEVYAKYKHQLDKATAELQASLLKFETAPEQHPLYPTEWKSFWQRRSVELQKEGKEPADYDFSADWTRFWLVRVHELNDEELRRSDRRIRRDLQLSLDGVIVAPKSKSSLASAEQHASGVQSKSKTPAQVDERDRDRRKRSDSDTSKATTKPDNISSNKVSTTDRKREQLRERGVKNANESSSRARSDRDRSPAARKTSTSDNKSKTSSGAASSSRWSSSAAKSSSSAALQHTIDEPVTEDNVLDNLEPVTEPVTVISVLRLLSAFEDLLGSSLGPRVVDLLSKAVALEKVKANLADELLMSADNSVLLDTVKEKLKGLLLAGCVESFKVRSVRKVIAHVMSITRIIDQQTKLREEQNMAEARLNLERLKEQERLADEQRKLREAEQKRREEADSRGLVMKQLATSITLQGKEITKEQLEALTDVYLENHSADDTPYLFGLQMGSRFPDLKEESNGSSQGLLALGKQQQHQHQQHQQQQHQQQQQQQQQRGQQLGQLGQPFGLPEPVVECPDQHPMLWNAHHQPQASNYGGQFNGGLQQQQPQQQQQMFQYGYYNNSNNSSNNNQLLQQQHLQPQQTQYQQQQQQQQQQHSNLGTTSSSVGNDRGNHSQHRQHRGQGQSSTSSYERTVTLPYQQQQQPSTGTHKSSSGSSRSSRTTGSSSNHRSSYY